MSRCTHALLLAAVAIGCSSQPDCDLRAELRARAGTGAIDCGHAVLGGGKPVDDCVVGAFNSGGAFFALYDQWGIDSKVVSGVAGDKNGGVTFLLWQDAMAGSGGHPVITGDTCIGPAVDTSQPKNPSTPPLTCATTSSLGRTCG